MKHNKKHAHAHPPTSHTCVKFYWVPCDGSSLSMGLTTVWMYYRYTYNARKREWGRETEKLTVSEQARERGSAAVAVIIFQVNSNYQEDWGSECRTHTDRHATTHAHAHNFFTLRLAVFSRLFHNQNMHLSQRRCQRGLQGLMDKGFSQWMLLYTHTNSLILLQRDLINSRAMSGSRFNHC